MIIIKIDATAVKTELARNCATLELLINSGISRSTIHNAMHGKPVSTKTVGKIAKALNVDVTKIIETR